MKVNQKIKKVSFIGMGLINSSLARDLKIKKFYLSSSAYSRRLSTINKIKKLKLVDFASSNIEKTIKEADIIVVGIPVAAYQEVFKKICNHIKPGAIITDVGSVKKEVINHIIIPVLKNYDIPYEDEFIVNGTGRFVYGGPAADTGLTGRKIIVDTYGGYAPHGGGAFSGKDPSKVDRSAAYMSRYIAKNVVASGLAERCEVQLSYGIGVAEPTSFYVKSFGTGEISDEDLTKICSNVFPLRPGEIVNHLDLKKPRYYVTSSYGHFGRNGETFTWEKTDLADKLKSAANI